MNQDHDKLHCPRCGGTALPVSYTRHRDGQISRLRGCRDCGHRILTREGVVGSTNLKQRISGYQPTHPTPLDPMDLKPPHERV